MGARFYFISAVLRVLFSCSKMSLFCLETCSPLKGALKNRLNIVFFFLLGNIHIFLVLECPFGLGLSEGFCNRSALKPNLCYDFQSNLAFLRHPA